MLLADEWTIMASSTINSFFRFYIVQPTAIAMPTTADEHARSRRGYQLWLHGGHVTRQKTYMYLFNIVYEDRY
jgi:hypothetical protein